jgi:EAL domain-containing protein (putative c-di-GMP-specific phosphodiesterase class I)
MLATQGCDLAQGYYLCRPLPAPDLVRWFQARSPKAT